MSPSSRWFAAVVSVALFPTFAARVARADDASEAEQRLAVATRSLAQATETARAAHPGGIPFHAELETDHGRVVFSIDLAIGKRTRNVVLDAKDGASVAVEDDDEDHAATVGAATVTLEDAIAKALAARPGRAVEAKLVRRGAVPTIAVRILADHALATVVVDAIRGTVAAAPPERVPPEEEAFTRAFVVAEDEWTSTGVSPFFDLRPGAVLVLAGTDDGAEVRLEITVKDEVVVIDGVETRVVEERETVAGALKEVSRNYFALSRRTNDVYDFGEDVDVYANGAVTGHPGSWRSGVQGAKFGLLVPGSPLRGARWYEEVAPGVAMDRAEIVSLTEVVVGANGPIEGCVAVEESTPLEPGHVERKAYARGIGLVRDGPLRFVARTAPK